MNVIGTRRRMLVLLVAEVVVAGLLVLYDIWHVQGLTLSYGKATALYAPAFAALVLLRRRDLVLAGGVAVALSLVASLLRPAIAVAVGSDSYLTQLIAPSFAELFGLMVLVVAAIRRLPRRQAALSAAACTVAAAAALLLRINAQAVCCFPEGTPLGHDLLEYQFFRPVPQIVALTIAVAVAVAVGVVLRGSDERRDAAVVSARTQERIDIARELHDVVAHDVTGIILHAQAAQLGDEGGAAGDPARMRSSLALIEHAGIDALDSMRRIVGVLRSTDEADRSPEPGLTDLVGLTEGFTHNGGAVDLTLPDEPEHALPAGIGTAIFRVVQESLTNARRHAPTLATVTVTVERPEPGRLTLSVINDGVTGTREPGGFGVLGMEERVRALGGRLTAGPDGNGNWLVRAELPLGPAGT